jgi:hypothetical protein
LSTVRRVAVVNADPPAVAPDVTLSIYGSTALVDLDRFFQFRNLNTVGTTPWTGD